MRLHQLLPVLKPGRTCTEKLLIGASRDEPSPIESKEPSSFHCQTLSALAAKHCSEGAGRMLVLHQGRLKRLSQDQKKRSKKKKKTKICFYLTVHFRGSQASLLKGLCVYYVIYCIFEILLSFIL